MKTIILSYTLFVLPSLLFCQEPPMAIRNFSFMVIPYLNDGEIISDKLQKSPDLRNSITIVQNELLGMKLKTLDFAAKYQKFLVDAQMQEKLNDTKAAFLEFAAPDVYVELDVEHLVCPDGTHKARVTLKSFLTSSGELLATRTEDSNCIAKEADMVQLVKNATKFFLKDYVTNLQMDLVRMVETGQPIDMKINISNNALFDLHSTAEAVIVEGQPTKGLISELISEWMGSQPNLVLFFDQRGGSDQSIIFDEVRIPMVNKETSSYYPIDSFTKKMRVFIESIQLADVEGSPKIKVKLRRINSTVYLTLE